MSFRRRTLLLLVSIACAFPVASRATETTVVAPAPTSGFVTTLSTEDRAAAGLDKLTPEQQTELNNYVAREAALARAGNVRGFAGTFVGRRNPAEQVAAGLGRLTDAEQAKLNELVAGVIASGANLT
ncbi:MAG TPA: hypothetical protein VFJ90_08180, partial [Candidatus Didemnitutus sp.]|nr:hypothetical protein [Candidatus Didemnitutus sp.]